MPVFNPLPIAFADLRRSRAGAIAVTLLVAVAVAVGVGVSAQERALRDGSAHAADAFDLIIGAPGSETQLVLSTVYLQPGSLNLIDGSILADLQEREGVAFASPIGFGDSWQGHPVVGVTPEFIAEAGGGIAEGEPFARIDQAVVGIDVPLEPGEVVTPAHGMVLLDDEDEAHAGIRYTVVGRMPRLGNPWDEAMLVPIEAVWWVHGLPTGHAPTPEQAERLLVAAAAETQQGEGEDHDEELHEEEVGFEHALDVAIGPPYDRRFLPGVPAIVVRPEALGGAYALRQEYRNDPRTNALFPAEVLIQLYSILGDVRDVLSAFAVVTQVLVIGAVLLAVLASMAQRRRMVAVLRALGASRAFVFSAVWLNVSLMIALGGLLGLGLGWAGAFALSAWFSAQTHIAMSVTISAQEVGMVAALIGLGLVLATIPAAMSYRQPVSAALKA